jgi:hypothetical protein
LTKAGEKASNHGVVQSNPSREEKLLSDHVFSIFGRTLTITGYEQLVTGVIVLIVLTAWAIQQFRRKRTVVVQRSVVSDQVVYELARIADALDRIANRPADEAIAAASLNSPPPQARGVPLSIFGR